jgi:N-acetylglutamate synthase-like GNAT family acetyltransferase
MKILENNLDYLHDFIRLNEEWITQYFTIEKADMKLAENPTQIIDDGGYIFSLKVEKKIVGVCALFHVGDKKYELARMAVSSNYQGNGYGEKLMQCCIDKLSQINAKRVYLLSNTKLIAAISLYKKYGFKVVSVGQHPVYARANIVMERNFDELN